MLRTVRALIRRMGFVGACVLALAFSAPAFESHACAADAAALAGDVLATVADHGEICADCGPACATMCCHAPHMAIAADFVVAGSEVADPTPFWTRRHHLVGHAPPGPDQPPRV